MTSSACAMPRRFGSENGEPGGGLWIDGAGGASRRQAPAPASPPGEQREPPCGRWRRCLPPGRHLCSRQRSARERPLEPLVDALRTLGADITYLGNEDFALRNHDRPLTGGTVRIDGTLSSQFVTALLMLALVFGLYPSGRRTGFGPLPGDHPPLPGSFGVDAVLARIPKAHRPSGALVAPGHLPVERTRPPPPPPVPLRHLPGAVRVTGVGRDGMQGDVAFFGLVPAGAGAVLQRTGTKARNAEGGTLRRP